MRATDDDRAASPPVVLVVGASSGIGRATARELAARGAHLVLSSRAPGPLAQVAGECRELGAGSVLVVPCDVGDREAVESVFDEALATHGRVDGVVHTAAVLAYGAFADVPAEVFERVIRTNVIGTANVARCALQAFTRDGHGRLVVVGSILGKVAPPLMSNYVTSKWAVHGLVRSLQIEARRLPDVGITLISPGSVNTPVYAQAGSYTGSGGRPPPPVDAPERVARAIVAALDKPRRERSVGLFNPLLVLGFRVLPGVFDAIVAPLFSLLAQTRAAVPRGPGNVLAPAEDGEALHAGWRQLRR